MRKLGMPMQIGIALTALMLATTFGCATVVSRDERDLVASASDRTVADIGHLVAAASGFANEDSRSEPTRSARAALAARLAGFAADLAALEANHIDRIGGTAEGVATLLSLDRAVGALTARVADPAGSLDLAASAAGIQASLGRLTETASAESVRISVAAQAALTWSHRLLLAAELSTLTWLAGLLAAVLMTNGRLHVLARRDTLTGLRNRLTFTEQLSAVMKDPGPGNEVALMLLDVDLFKDINDSLGHATGDAILKEIARRLAGLPSEGLHASRLGGDEFAVILTAQQAHRAAGDTVDRLMRCLASPFDVAGERLTVTLSIGIALTPMQWCDAETMLKNADLALYAAKAAGRGTFRFFNPRMDREASDRRAMQDDLRKAVAARELELHFQPIVDLATGRIVNCEALARWNRAGHGFVSPMTFITLAEEIGLIREIGDFVLNEACRAALSWPEDVRVSINLSPHQFDDGGLVATVTRILAETGLAPDRVELEITETLLLRHNDAVLTALRDFRLLGVQIALDDFGTGYSSLSYLQRFSIDRIKIDQSFVRDMPSSPGAAAIVESVCQLAARLGIATTGEGIETEVHAAMLRGFGCNEGQGYLFARPMPLAGCLDRFGAAVLRRDAA